MLYKFFAVIGIASLLSFGWAQSKGYSVLGSAASERSPKGSIARTYHK